MNWYAYCGGNPVNRWDPSGLSSVDEYARLKGVRDQMVEQIKTTAYNKWVQSITTQFNCPVNIVVSEDSTVDIYAFLKIYGSAANMIIEETKKSGTSGISYGQAVIDGIISNWQGSYGDKTVNVHVVELDDNTNKIIPLDIEVKDESGVCHMPGGAWKSINNPGNIIMYAKYPDDWSSGGQYRSASSFGWTSAHEFGHALGIGDRNAGNQNIVSIMGDRGQKATELDLELALKCHKDVNVWQEWSDNTDLIKSYGTVRVTP